MYTGPLYSRSRNMQGIWPVTLLLAAVFLTAVLCTSAVGQKAPPPSGPIPCPSDTYSRFLAARSTPLAVTSVAAKAPMSMSGGGSSGVLGVTNLPRIVVFVNDTLYPQIVTNLNTYVADLQFEGYEVEVYRIAGGTAENLRSILQSRYENGRLVGAVLIGQLPYALFEMEYEFALWTYVAYPCDMFLMDLDAQWLDTNPFPTAKPLVYDGYVNGTNRGPEIYVGRIDASNLDPIGFTYEVQRTNAYLAKTHAWHTYTMARANRGLSYAIQFSATQDAYPSYDIVAEGGTAGDYLSRIQRDPAIRSDAYEMVDVEGHGCPWGSYIGDNGGWLSSQEIYNGAVKSQFYNLRHCQISMYTYVNENNTYHGCVGNYYLFGANSSSLVTIGSTKVTFPIDAICTVSSAIAGHGTIGGGYKQYCIGQAPFDANSWYDLFGYVILGDPTAMPFPPPMHVKPDGNDALNGYTWDTAKRTINGAMSALPANLHDGEIWVKAGTYNERVTFTRPIRLYGGFAGTETSLEQRNPQQNTTTIDGQGGDTIALSNLQGSGSRVDGFTIRNSTGSGRGISCSSSTLTLQNDIFTAGTTTNGGGVYGLSSTLSISNCTFSGSSAGVNGGGLYCQQCTGSVSDCTFSDNAAGTKGGAICMISSGMPISDCELFQNGADKGGAIACYGSPAPTITRCSFSANSTSGSGAGVHCESSSAAITQCTFTGNSSQISGGAMGCQSCSPSISLCTFSGNDATYYGGAFYLTSSSASIVNNNIRANSAPWGGAFYCCCTSNVGIVNNTIVENTASSYGGGIYMSGSSPTIKNNILAFNSDGISACGGSPVLSNNDFWLNNGSDYLGLEPGANDIGADPKFANRICGDFHLTSVSRCIDAGTNDGAPSADFDGNPRPFDGDGNGTATCDIGAYELRRIYVRSDSPGPTFNGRSWATAYHTIAQGMAAAGANDEIWVAAGTYNEAVNLKNGVRMYGGFGGSELLMPSRDPAAHPTIITGGGAVNAVTMSSLSDPLSRIDGFTITNSVADGVGVYASGSGGVIEGCIISGNDGGGIRCIEAPDCARLTIARNTIAGNHADEYGGGILVDSSGCEFEYSNTYIIGNIIRGNSSVYGGGICSYECNGGVAISSNTIVDNTATGSGGGIYMYISCPTVENNIIAYNSVYGVSYYYGGCNPLTLPLRNNDVYGNTPSGYYGLDAGPTDISQDPLFLDRTNGDLHLTSSSACINAGCDDARGQLAIDIDGQSRPAGRVDIGADEYGILHVSTTGSDSNDGYTWARAKRTIQAAVNAAANRGEVWVKAGTYNEMVTMKSSVQIYGGFAGAETRREQRNWASNVTTIDGGANDKTIVMTDLADPWTTVDGFVIRHSAGTNAKGVYCEGSSGVIAHNCITANNGGGIYCTNDSVIAVTDNTITVNSGNGGISAWNSAVTITGNYISLNSAGSSAYGGGGILTVSSDALVANNTITENTSACGGGIYCMFGAPTITGNMVTANDAVSAGGVYFSNVFDGEISGNTISDNTCDKGGGIYACVSWTEVKNNVLSGNSGGGIYLEDSADFPITNNTIVGNTGYGGIYSEANGSPTYKNNIIAYNNWGIYNGLFGDCRANPTLSNNDVFGNTAGNYGYVSAGTGDISANPFLVNRSAGDFHLRAKSPCVDAGTNTGAPSVDRDGHARPVDGDGNGTATCDMGAYERPMDLCGTLKNYANGSRVDLWSMSVVANFAGADPSGQNWVYIENTDRTAGIRVKTAKTFSLNQLVRVTGTIQSDTSTGERYISADADYPKTDGGSFTITPIGMRNLWLGGHASGYEPVIKDGFGFYNVGMLVQSWGRVTYVNAAGRYFYINDGSGLRDGSGYTGVRVVAPTGVSLPTLSSFVKVKGVSGASLIGANYVRTLRVRTQSDITGVVSWISGSIGLARSTWNSLAMPGIPAYPEPESVFVGSPGEPGIQIGGYLRRYDAPTQQWLTHNEGCVSIGDCLLGDGYLLYIPPNGAASYDFARTPAEGDQMLSLPVGSQTPANCSFVGSPFAVSVPWASCLITDGSWIGTLPEAVESGYIHKVCSWNGWGWTDVTNLSTGSMASGAGYLIYPRYNNLAVIVPAQ